MHDALRRYGNRNRCNRGTFGLSDFILVLSDPFLCDFQPLLQVGDLVSHFVLGCHDRRAGLLLLVLEVGLMSRAYQRQGTRVGQQLVHHLRRILENHLIVELGHDRLLHVDGLVDRVGLEQLQHVVDRDCNQIQIDEY